MLSLLILASLMLTETSATSTNNELTCTICVDIVTEIGNCFKYLKIVIVGIPGKNLLLLEVFQYNCVIPSSFLPSLSCSPKLFVSHLFPLKDLNLRICFWFFLAARAALYLHICYGLIHNVAIQRDRCGNARIWSDNLQLACVQPPTSSYNL